MSLLNGAIENQIHKLQRFRTYGAGSRIEFQKNLSPNDCRALTSGFSTVVFLNCLVKNLRGIPNRG
jgi:hypothetical protein